MKCFCTLWLCVGPYPRLPPTGQRTSTRIGLRSPYIVTDFDTRLRSWSNMSAAKSPNMASSTTWSPDSARPPATPAIPASLNGVDSTRSGWLVDRPLVTLKAPPYGSTTSSPSRYRSARSSNSRRRAEFRLSTTRGARSLTA